MNDPARATAAPAANAAVAARARFRGGRRRGAALAAPIGFAGVDCRSVVALGAIGSRICESALFVLVGGTAETGLPGRGK
ncbi:MAG: hypothetical protein HOP29_12870 [Phycisphaerales bacterium]|nr:hypothetical protein [Phycisphaerales bacterium]